MFLKRIKRSINNSLLQLYLLKKLYIFKQRFDRVRRLGDVFHQLRGQTSEHKRQQRDAAKVPVHTQDHQGQVELEAINTNM